MSDQETNNITQKDLVVVGSSAGGIEALSVLVNTLPLDFPAPLVLAQHLDPNRFSTLDVILQRRTHLPVEVVLEGTTLEPGRIYVIPANRHVSIRDHHVEIQEDNAPRPRPSVDLLLSTASQAYGEHLIAVILTGTGVDGAMGAMDVKNAGGTVIVQNPQTARYPSMPLSLPPTAIDFVTDLEHIGPLLYNLLMNVKTPSIEKHNEDAFQHILEQVSQQANIDFHAYKTSTILRRLSKRMVVTQCPTMHSYADYVREHAEEVDELVKTFLINVTQFFRDTEAFEYLRKEILPTLIAEARPHGRTLRFWDAGCATGEEAYSLAMLVADLLGAELSQWNVKIFATDLDEAAINFARRGVYSEHLLKGLPKQYQERFFEPSNEGYRIAKVLRQMIIFGQQDLTRSAPFPRIDLILCRNVLIYFTTDLQEHVLSQFAFSLDPNGYLFLGRAETVRAALPLYELVNKQWKVYRCIGKAPITLRDQASVHTDIQHPKVYEPREEKHVGEQPAQPGPPFELGQLRRFNELILRFLPIGIVVIDRNYRVLTANGTARRLLGLREAGVDMDFLHAIHGVPYHEMRAAIDNVLRQHMAVDLPEIELEAGQKGTGHFINLSLTLAQLDTALPELVIISTTDITQQVQARQKIEKAHIDQANLVNELESANTRLNDTNRELIESNEKLQIANEELLLTHEELQASIEEFETTNEELQATNEEIETSNEELQATNEEIQTINEELRARTNELQGLSALLESERERLAEIVELAPFYSMMLHGPNLVVEAYNPRFAQQIEQQEVQGHPLEAVIDLFWENGQEIAQLVKDAYHLETVQKIRRVPTHLRHPQEQSGSLNNLYFSYIAIPARNHQGEVDGVLLYALDETEEHLHEVEQEQEREQLKLIFNNVSLVALALFDAQTRRLLMGSTPYLTTLAQMNNSVQEDLIGRTWDELNIVLPQEQKIQVWDAVIQQCTAIHIPELVITGQGRIWDYTIAPLVRGEGQGHVRYVLISLVDITEQAQARRELERVDLLKDEFLALAAHELRTPLTAIQGHTQILQRALRKVQEQHNPEAELAQGRERALRTLDTIIHQVTRINRLLAEMLDMTRIRENVLVLDKAEHVDLLPLVQRLIEPYQALGREIIVRAEGEHFSGTYDSDRIEQVLANLISNAVKYSHAEKPVTITFAHQDAEIHVAVRDEGEGISTEDQPHIFERFYRTAQVKQEKKDGLGLGLYISSEIVKQHGGRIWCESEEGQGSTFTFALPWQPDT